MRPTYFTYSLCLVAYLVASCGDARSGQTNPQDKSPGSGSGEEGDIDTPDPSDTTGSPESEQSSPDPTESSTSDTTPEDDEGSFVVGDYWGGGGTPVDCAEETLLSICDLWSQDCPEGEKCVPVTTECEGEYLDYVRCVPVVGDKKPSQPCSLDSPQGGNDDCDADSYCFNGICHPFCQGSADEPICEQGQICGLEVLESNPYSGEFVLCHFRCDPLDFDAERSMSREDELERCPDDLQCVRMGELDFACDHPGANRQTGQACERATDCDHGLNCVDASIRPDCSSELYGCCTPFCDLRDPDSCPDEKLNCEPLPDSDALPDDRKHIGQCSYKAG